MAHISIDYSQKNGFTLIELSVALMIVGILAAGAASALIGQMKGKALKTTRENMATIENALTSYYVMNRHYPCPAPIEAVYGDPDFGRAAETCLIKEVPQFSTDKIKTISATNPAGKKVAIGLIPFRSLGIPDSTGIDGWGNIYHYSVTETLTDTAQFSQTEGAIDIVSEDGKSRVEPPHSIQFIVFSTGPNGRGGFSAQGTPLGPCPIDAPEGENCDRDTAYMDSAPQVQGKDYIYDDLVFYRQYNTNLESNGGLLLLYKGSCMKDFSPMTIRGEQPVGIETLAKDRESLKDNSADNMVLCYSSKYATKMTYQPKERSDTPKCPDQWTFIGYKFYAYSYAPEDETLRNFQDMEGDTTLITCAR